jgi:hypothetical protein
MMIGSTISVQHTNYNNNTVCPEASKTAAWFMVFNATFNNISVMSSKTMIMIFLLKNIHVYRLHKLSFRDVLVVIVW